MKNIAKTKQKRKTERKKREMIKEKRKY